MSVSQSQTESGGLVGSSSRALLIPPGGGVGGCGRGCGCGGSALCSIPFCNSQHLGPFCAFFFLSVLGFVRCKRWRARGLANFESQNGHPAVCSATVADCNPAACRPAACSTTFAAFISAPPQSHRRVTDWTPDLIRASWSGSLGRPRSDPPRWYAIVLPGRKSAAGRRADFGVFPVAVRPKRPGRPIYGPEATPPLLSASPLRGTPGLSGSA